MDKIVDIMDKHEKRMHRIFQEDLKKSLIVGDVVSAVWPSDLRSGSGRYEEAIVVKTWPNLTLASFAGDMRWTNINDMELFRVGHVGWWKRRRAMTRAND